ncbi:MAG: hypothetical protein H7833_18820 [Magnetococcus sp. DMHC-1]|nr:hypothetical protein [Magnetococcales bacterium]
MTDTQSAIVKGIDRQVMNELVYVPDDTVVSLAIGRSSLSTIALKLQKEAEKNGVTVKIHDDLMSSIKNDR